MTIDRVKIKNIAGSVAACIDTQLTVETSVDADLGYRMWGGKDGVGNITKWLAKDKPAYVQTLRITDLSLGPLQTDADGDVSSSWELAVPGGSPGTTHKINLTAIGAGHSVTDPSGTGIMAHVVVSDGLGGWDVASFWQSDSKILINAPLNLEYVAVPAVAGDLGYNDTDNLPSAHNGTREVVLGKFGSSVDVDVTDVVDADCLIYDSVTSMWISSANGLPANGFREAGLLMQATYSSPTLSVVFSVASTGNVVLYHRGKIVAEEFAGTWTAPPLTLTGVTAPRYLIVADDGDIEWVALGDMTPTCVVIACAVVSSSGTYYATLPRWHSVGMSPLSALIDRERRGAWFPRNSVPILSGYATLVTTPADRRPTVTAGYVFGQDRFTGLASMSSGRYMVANMYGVYGSGGGVVLTGGQTEFCLLSGGIPRTNRHGSGIYSAVDLPDGNYGYYYIVAVPTGNDATSQLYSYLSLMGQHDGTLDYIRNVHPSDLELMDLLDNWSQFVFVAKIIIKRTGSDWTIKEVQECTGDQAAQIDRAGTRAVLDVTTDGTSLIVGGFGDEQRVGIATALPAVLALTSDTPAALTAPTVRDVLLTGSASNAPVSLPNATTLRGVGDTFRITNAMTDVAIVQNYGTASSVFEFLMPGDTLVCVCTSIATAAGTWAVTKIDAPESKKLKFFDDMLNVGDSTTLEPSQGRMIKGTGSVSVMRGDSTHGCNGVHVMALGTDAGLGGYVSQQYFGYDNTSTPLVSGKALLMACKVYVYNQSDATNETVFRFGTLDNNTKVKPTSGIFVETDQDGDIIGVTGVSSSYTDITGGGKIKTNGDSTASEMVIVVKSDLSRVDLWVDKAHIGSSTTNIPTASLGSVIGYHYGRVAGTGSSRDAYVDYFQYERVK